MAPLDGDAELYSKVLADKHRQVKRQPIEDNPGELAPVAVSRHKKKSSSEDRKKKKHRRHEKEERSLISGAPQKGLVVATRPASQDSALFTLDTRGDPQNMAYGGLYKRDITA
jgi:hypothetical protein